jgi:hypothetical protein
MQTPHSEHLSIQFLKNGHKWGHPHDSEDSESPLPRWKCEKLCPSQQGLCEYP